MYLRERHVLENLQKKKVVPAAPNSKTPTGAEFHPNFRTWNPRYDRYRVVASIFRQIATRWTFRCRSRIAEAKWATMKMPMTLMKNAIVGRAKT